MAGVANLYAMEIDPDKATEEYRERILGPFRTIMPADVVASIEEQFRSPCTTEMASFDRFVDFMDGAGFDLIVFDTAPTGHTIRLLELPVDWSKHIEESAKGSGQTCLGPVAAFQESKAKYDRAITLLTDPARTRFVFVLQPERTALYETERAATELGRIGVKSQELIVNGLLPAEACESPFFRRRHGMQQEQQAEIRLRFALPVREMLLRDEEVKGLASLREVIPESKLPERPNKQPEIFSDIIRDDSQIQGIGASFGTYRGRARIIDNSVHLPDISPGEIPVAQNIGPRWTPIFPTLGGIVLDGGSVGQHHAIIAREYGIPAVVGTGNATHKIPEGAWISIDGTTGNC